jgi:hypothetical protein
MTRRVLILSIVSTMLLVPARALAHDKYRVIGPVVELDEKANLLKVKTSDKQYPAIVEMDLTSKTRIERDGKEVPRAALKRGVHVVVDALGDDVFSLEAVTIRIVPAPK